MRNAAVVHRQPSLELSDLRVLAAALLAALALAPAAAAGGPPELTPVVGGLRPADRDLAPERVLALARATPEVQQLDGPLDEHLYTRGEDEWQVSFHRGEKEVAQVVVDDTGTVLEAWTGVQVEWQMARGYEGAFGRRATGLAVWLGCLALFLAPFARPPWRLLHLDLLAVASLSVSFALFSHAQIAWSVPLTYPPLLYLLGRLLHLARRPPERPPQPLAVIGLRYLGAAIAFLVAFRVGLQFVSSNVIDVGYAGVIGADRLAHLDDLYGSFPPDNARGDTYGPFVYIAYIPFELIWPWTGAWDALPAAHVASATFDLACALGLFLVGRRRSPQAGLLLAYLWLACPFTLMIANSGANDALTGALVLAAVAAPAAGGALGMAAALTKFAPAILLPLLVRTRRQLLGAVAVLAAGLLLVAGDISDFIDRTLGFQTGRDSPFSVWGLYDLPAQRLAQLAVLALAVAVARRGGERFALAAALLIAVQLTADHWFYLYLGWFLPVALVAFLAPYAIGRSTGSIEAAERGASPQRTRTALSHGSSVATP